MSNSAVSDGESTTIRPRSHIAIEGAADSTSPRPASSFNTAVGRPTAWHTAVMIPIGSVARNVTKMCSPKSFSKWLSARPKAWSTSSASDIAARSGRDERRSSTIRSCSSTSGRSGVVSTQPNVSAIFSVSSGRSKPGFTTNSGTPGASPKNASSMSLAVMFGARWPSIRSALALR